MRAAWLCSATASRYRTVKGRFNRECFCPAADTTKQEGQERGGRHRCPGQGNVVSVDSRPGSLSTCSLLWEQRCTSFCPSRWSLGRVFTAIQSSGHWEFFPPALPTLVYQDGLHRPDVVLVSYPSSLKEEHFLFNAYKPGKQLTANILMVAVL